MREEIRIKGINFCAAHRVLGHPGKCKQLHGHNYSVEVCIEYDPKLRNSMCGYFIDFGAVKEGMKLWVDTHLDHSTILQTGDSLIEAIERGAANQKITEFNIPPTAEGIAMVLVRVFKDQIILPYVRPRWSGEHGYILMEVTVHETENCSATAREYIDDTP
jgi:6-pyruvoyltetrahydropterin/6-carboxytetrahydropterin synthase